MRLWEQVVPKLESTIIEQLVQQIVVQVVPQLQQTDNQHSMIWQQLVAKLISIPWGHHILITQKVKGINQASVLCKRHPKNLTVRFFSHAKVMLNLISPKVKCDYRIENYRI